MQFTYNDFGQSTQTFQEHDGTVNTGTSPSVQRGYANGSTNTVRPLSLTYPNGRELAYDYGTTDEINDALSRIGSIIDDDTTHLADYEFLGLAGVIQQTSPQPNLRYTLTGVSNDPDTGDIYTGLDRFGRVKDSRWYNTSTNDDLSRIQYGYDRASNRIWRKNPIATANSAEYDWLYTYDGLQRLKTANRGTLNGTQTALASTAFKQDWNLDPTGNWEGFKQSNNGSTWSMEQERTANPVNEITDITNATGTPWADPAYNGVGNMTTIPKPKQMDESYTATYDAWNRLVKLEEEVSSTLETVAEYQYDARNFRVMVHNYASGMLDESVHTYFTDSWRAIENRPGVYETPSFHYTWGVRYIDSLICVDMEPSHSTGGLVYVAQDESRNVTSSIIASGVAARFEYMCYGERTVLTELFESATTNHFEPHVSYSGCFLDQNTGLHLIRHRFLNTQIGTWISQDPIQSAISLYEYAYSSPQVWNDSSGLAPESPANISGVPVTPCTDVCGPDVTDWFYKDIQEHILYAGSYKGTFSSPFTFRDHAADLMSHKWMDFSQKATSGQCGTGKCANTVSLSGVCIRKNQLGNILFMIIGQMYPPSRFLPPARVASQGYNRGPTYKSDHKHSNTFGPYKDAARADNLAAFGVGSVAAIDTRVLSSPEEFRRLMGQMMNEQSVIGKYSGLAPGGAKITPDTLTFVPDAQGGFNTRSCKPCGAIVSSLPQGSIKSAEALRRDYESTFPTHGLSLKEYREKFYEDYSIPQGI